MWLKFPIHAVATALASICCLLPVRAAGTPEDQFAGTIKALLGKDFVADWQGVEKLPQVRWAPLPPKMLQNCLADGGCFTRQGVAAIGGINLAVTATGARTIISNIYFRNVTAPFGEEAVVAALKREALSVELVRCPIKIGAGGMNWYLLKGRNTNPGYLSIRSCGNGKPCEGFVLSLGADLPPLEPNQVRLYTEQCSATGADRKPISTVLPHEQLALTLVALLPQTAGPSLYDWKTLTLLPTKIHWPTEGPKRGDLSFRGDPNPWMHQGTVDYSGRQFSILVSGSTAQVKAIYFDEGGMHPLGEDLPGLLRMRSLTVQLARCGPVYTESTNNWYSVTSPTTRPIMLKQSIRFDGNRAQDSYELRLDASLPKRDPRDRDPGVGGCK